MNEYKRIPYRGNPFDLGTTIHFEKDGIYIAESHLAYDEKLVTVVFFVSGVNGDEFGQFPTLELALKKARELTGGSK